MLCKLDTEVFLALNNSSSKAECRSFDALVKTICGFETGHKLTEFKFKLTLHMSSMSPVDMSSMILDICCMILDIQHMSSMSPVDRVTQW